MALLFLKHSHTHSPLPSTSIASLLNAVAPLRHRMTEIARRTIVSAALAWFGAAAAIAVPAPATAQVVINEFMASNGESVADEDGDFEDWIELYNAGTVAVNLDGYGLSDDEGNPFRWILPSVTVEPGTFLLVWASGKDRTELAEPLHANFSISSDGEPLSLTRPDGETADAVPPVALGRDHSYGRVPDGTGDWYYFDGATPGAANTTTAYEAWLQPPDFSHSGGFHAEAFTLELTSAHPGATILYTLDGSDPHPGSIDGVEFNYKNQFPASGQRNVGALLTAETTTEAYTEPWIIVSRAGEPNWLSRFTSTPTWSYPPAHMPSETADIFKGTVVRARAVREGALPSEVATHTYFVTPEGPEAFDFPIFAVTVPPASLFGYESGIYTPGKMYDDWWLENPGERGLADWRRPGNYTQRGREWERAGHVEFFSASGERLLAQNAGVRAHGGASRRDAMKSLRLYARGSYDDNSHFNQPFFDGLNDIYGRPVSTFKRMILRSGGNDNLPGGSRIRDVMFQTVLRPLGIDDQRHLTVLHFINGYFWGHVDLRERIDRHYIAGRYLIDPEDVAVLTLFHTFGIAIGGPQLSDGTEEDLQDFVDLLAFVEDRDLKVPEHFDHVADRIDVENFLLYNVGNIYIGNTDWPHNNNDWWRKRNPDRRPGAPSAHDGRWRWIINDTDLGFCMHGCSPAYNDTVGWATRDESWGEDPARVEATLLLRRLLTNDGFRDRFINALADHMATTFHPERVEGLIRHFDAIIAPLRDVIDGEEGIHHARYRGRGGSSSHIESRLVAQARVRPDSIVNQLRDNFGLGEPVPMVFDASHASRGALQINTVRVGRGTPGLADPDRPFPFNARYFPSVPIQVTAVPEPGYRFLRWKEYPDHESATIELLPSDGHILTAVFGRGPVNSVAAYWNFNDTEALLAPAYAGAGAALVVVPGPGTAVVDGGGNGFAGENALDEDPAGRHLRVNNPLGSVLEFHLPTTGYSHPALTYEARRSGQGAGIQTLEYSVGGAGFQEFAKIQVFEDDPIVYRFDFAAIAASWDNPDFRVRIRFEESNGGRAGNNRIDNVVLGGRELWVGSIFEGSETTDDHGHGWKANRLGYLFDRAFPFVYSTAAGAWLYVVGESEDGFHFWDYGEEFWAWTSADHYPALYVLSGTNAGTWIEYAAAD